MRKIKLFGLSIEGVALRFYAMMTAIIALGFLNQFTLATILGFTLAASFILGISYTKPASKKETRVMNSKIQKPLTKAA